jgi:hypothetical protein
VYPPLKGHFPKHECQQQPSSRRCKSKTTTTMIFRPLSSLTMLLLIPLASCLDEPNGRGCENFEAVSDAIRNNPLSTDSCRINNECDCGNGGGCCRFYNWLECDCDDDFSQLRVSFGSESHEIIWSFMSSNWLCDRQYSVSATGTRGRRLRPTPLSSPLPGPLSSPLPRLH